MKKPNAKKLPSGNWFCRVRVNGQDVSITMPTEKEAVAEAMAIKAGLKQPEIKHKAITLHDAMEQYIAARRDVLSESTIRGYFTIARTRFQQMQNQNIFMIGESKWQSAIGMEARMVSPKTLKNSWALVVSVLKENGVSAPNVRLPAQIKNEHPFLSPDEIGVFLNAIRDSTIEIPALLGLHSLRRSEILGLRWKDIDLGKGLIHIRGAAVLDEHNTLVRKKTNKNTSSCRDVPIMIERLKELLQRSNQTVEYVVSCNPNAIWRGVNKVCRENGLPEIGTHGLRHSFASLAYHLNVPEKIAMDIGGWSDYQTMRKIYTHVAQKDLFNQVDSIKVFFNNVKNGNENGNENLKAK